MSSIKEVKNVDSIIYQKEEEQEEEQPKVETININVNDLIISNKILTLLATIKTYNSCNCINDDPSQPCCFDYDKQVECFRQLFLYFMTIPEFLKKNHDIRKMIIWKVNNLRVKEADNEILQATFDIFDLFINQLEKELNEKNN